ncbi:hypothetical protein LB566_21460 [Mesorhizobium sp. CA13]|uniref:hypothetical protein n=1 Tax=Mesorhizobium sp. CA13 TaxID=2876643 RepID=UPI001CCBB5CD|nr:hypothetical protein [Mesorhizobium sp. CA13]MBZ9856381.1 hypothetical protein [Mesorhizobium sp. CA13]
MRQSRSVPLAGPLVRHVRVEQGDAAVFDLVVRDRERTVTQRHFNPAHDWTVPDVAFHLLSASLIKKLAGPSAMVCRSEPGT